MLVTVTVTVKIVKADREMFGKVVFMSQIKCYSYLQIFVLRQHSARE